MRVARIATSQIALAAATALLLSACSAPTVTADQLNDAADFRDANAFAELLSTPADPEDAADLDAAVANLPALVNSEFTITDDGHVLLNGEPFGTVTDDGVVVSRTEAMLLDDDLGWSIRNGTSSDLDFYALLPGGRYHLTNNRTQDWFTPVIDGSPVSESPATLIATPDTVHLTWHPTGAGIDAAVTAAAEAFRTCETGCTTPEDVELTTTTPITPENVTTEPDPDGQTRLTMTAASVPVTYDLPYTTVKDITNGTATLTTVVEMVDGDLVADNVEISLK